jgi:cysteine-rich repeat protein
VTCGDGIVEESEECDDSNSSARDGCEPTCFTTRGFVCVGEPSRCSATCGDGALAPAEECDDGDAHACGRGLAERGHRVRGARGPPRPLVRRRAHGLLVDLGQRVWRQHRRHDRVARRSPVAVRARAARSRELAPSRRQLRGRDPWPPRTAGACEPRFLGRGARLDAAAERAEQPRHLRAHEPRLHRRVLVRPRGSGLASAAVGRRARHLRRADLRDRHHTERTLAPDGVGHHRHAPRSGSHARAPRRHHRERGGAPASLVLRRRRRRGRWHERGRAPDARAELDALAGRDDRRPAPLRSSARGRRDRSQRDDLRGEVRASASAGDERSRAWSCAVRPWRPRSPRGLAALARASCGAGARRASR